MKLLSLKPLYFATITAVILTLGLANPADAFMDRLMKRIGGGSSESSEQPKDITTLNYQEREILVYTPPQLPAPGMRALVIVMHGGMGNANRIVTKHNEKGLNMNSVAEKYGFVVAYLNGTAVTKRLGNDKKGWNAGNCCGQSAEKKIDDVSYIIGAVKLLGEKYGIDPARVYAIGHSNGGMMAQRLMCETTVFAAAIPISGPLGLDNISDCPAARGRNILAIHGENDANVPIGGGKGTKGISGAMFNSQEYSKQVFTNSGANYTLQLVPGADHNLTHIDEVIEKTEGMTISEKAARFFRLAH